MPDPTEDFDAGNTMRFPRFSTGQVAFRRYILEEVIGRGGMGVVWRARDEQLERSVALKVIPETLSLDRSALNSLKRETKLGLSLAHPNIVRIYDFLQEGQLAAISMEYVDGGTLSDLRAQQPHEIFEVKTLVPYVEALCDALDYAHTREKIVHRDLKPRNLMLTSQGQLKIADFGISRNLSEGLTMLTGALPSAGSPPYTSPQQWDGERPSPLDDIYSVGATLYELLSGRPPFLGVVDWQQIHHKVPPSLAQRRTDLGVQSAEQLPPAWEEAIAACLAKDPTKRPQSIQELWVRLSPAGTALPPPPPPPPPVEIKPAPKRIPLGEEEDDFEFGNTVVFKRPVEPEEVSVSEPAAPEPPAPEPAEPRRAEEPEELPELEPEPDPAPTSTLPAKSEPAPEAAVPEPEPELEPRPEPEPEPESESEPQTLPEPEPALAPIIPEISPVRPPVEKTVSPAQKRSVPRAVWFAGAAVLVVIGAGVLLIRPPHEPKAEENAGGLAIQSEPPGGKVVLDGGAEHLTPWTVKGLSAGRHHLTITRAGYEPVIEDFTFDGKPLAPFVMQAYATSKEPSPTPVSTPAPAAGTLSIAVSPEDAQVRLDDRAPVSRGASFAEVSRGAHKVTVSREGYEPVTKEFEFDPQRAQPLQITLSPTAQAMDLQLQAEAVKRHGGIPDSPQYCLAAAKYLQLVRSSPHGLTELKPESVRAELEKALEHRREAERRMDRTPSVQDFQRYKVGVQIAASELDILPAILLVADHAEGEEAFNWYCYAESAKQSAYAARQVGCFYYRGFHVTKAGEPDYETALWYFRTAAAAGDKEALVWIARCQLFGKGLPKDETAALKTLQELAEKGVAEGEIWLGIAYDKGVGSLAEQPPEVRMPRALELYNSALKHENWFAFVPLARLYERGFAGRDGKEQPPDPKKARALYKQGAEHEEPACMYLYGKLLAEQTGKAAAAERSDGVKWISKAAGTDLQEAQEWLKAHPQEVREAMSAGSR